MDKGRLGSKMQPPDALTSPYAAMAVPAATRITEAIIFEEGSSRRATNRAIMVTTGVNALSIWMKATVRYRYLRV